MLSYVLYTQTCQEEHKKHPADPLTSQFSKKSSEMWKTMSAKEKGNSEDMAKVDKARHERDMETYIPPKGGTKKPKGPSVCPKGASVPKRPALAFFFCSEYRPKVTEEQLGFPIGDAAKQLEELWNNSAAGARQLYEKKAAKLKEKCTEYTAAYRAKGEPGAAPEGVVQPEKARTKGRGGRGGR